MATSSISSTSCFSQPFDSHTFSVMPEGQMIVSTLRVSGGENMFDVLIIVVTLAVAIDDAVGTNL